MSKSTKDAKAKEEEGRKKRTKKKKILEGGNGASLQEVAWLKRSKEPCYCAKANPEIFLTRRFILSFLYVPMEL